MILVGALAVAMLLAGGQAWAGRLHPEVERQLATLPPGGTLAVIVEMVAQADPEVAAAAAPGRRRAARARAVVDALRATAAHRQRAVRAWLGGERALGNASRLSPFWVFNGMAVTATEPVIRQLAARDDVWEVRLDALIPPPAPIRSSASPAAGGSEWNIAQVRAPEVWALDPAYTGIGAVVGSFDTGVDRTHPDLTLRYRGDHAISWFDPYGEHAEPFDADGHGTHTTGTAVGGASGTSIGVAPGARWIAAKAWNDQGLGPTSAFHRIFEWFLAPGGDPANAPDVVNGSWAFAVRGCLTEFRADIQALRAAGIFPAFAAGNDGPVPGSVGSPGSDAESVAVGATDPFDHAASFSARGPSPCGGAVKPNVSAPGVNVVSAVPGGGYAAFSGTSMATPHVTGAVAVLRAINPALTVAELESVLAQGAVDLGAVGRDNAFGAGRLDLFMSAQIVLGGAARPLVTMTATSPNATEEGTTPGAFTVTRTGPTTAPLTVRYTVGGTATAGTDYVPLTGSVEIPADSAAAAIAVSPLDDHLIEPGETIVASLHVDAAYIVGSSRAATVTVVSDDVPPDVVAAALARPLGAYAPLGI